MDRMSKVNRETILIGVTLACLLAQSGKAIQAQPAGSQPRDCPLPLPSTLPWHEFETRLNTFLADRTYDHQPGHLRWKRDKQVRDTGDYLNGVSYGTHPAVRVYYSPAVIAWLEGDRKQPLPDGAMIVKEQYAPPAARYLGLSEDDLHKRLDSWTAMIKDASGSRDGWFWVDHAAPKGNSEQPPDPYESSLAYPGAGFGQYCIRCHASAEKEFTFVTLRNVKGYPGDPLTFLVDDSWKEEKNRPSAAREEQFGHGLSRRARRTELDLERPPIDSNFEFLSFFNQIPRVHYKSVVQIPMVVSDRVFCLPKGEPRFVTSDQCMSCHGGLSGPFKTMFVPKGVNERAEREPEIRGINFSPYGEWRWSLMGLSGRDPVFHAQLESELALHGKTTARTETIVDTCFRCHGAMGQRQHQADHREPFRAEFVRITDRSDPKFIYGALARDGVSCTVCHRIVDERQPIADLIMGNFKVTSTKEVYGPYIDKDISTYPMQNGLDFKPTHNPYIKSARLCASCHVLRMPVYDRAGNEVGKQFEQATYLEWLNSQYENEVNPKNPNAKTCQACHMPGDYHEPGTPDDKRVKVPLTRIAAIEDDSYPAAENRAPAASIHTGDVQTYSRHELLGINAFVLEMFNQFDNVLGVRKVDYMTGAVDGLTNAIEHSLHQARSATADVDILSSEIRDGKVVTTVRVTNLTGHRFPTGVGFRRAFLEFQVIDTSEGRSRMAWASGRTNSLGILVDDQGRILPSEFFEPDAHGMRHQPHYTKITEQNQVQIYQELSADPCGKVTTSFFELATTLKDNRLLPKGWSKEGPLGSGLPADFIEATAPVAVSDPDYEGPAGADTIVYEVPMGRWDPKQLKVMARLYYQSLPPSYLKMRFETAKGDATQRLHYLTSHLSLQNTRMKDW
ncbi:MAG TPA: cytochrome P460 family protein, partial [Isosphaeraceae bacterium]|nr:cytochrome P460 family protein [Isosphaeraceae bacterium]